MKKTSLAKQRKVSTTDHNKLSEIFQNFRNHTALIQDEQLRQINAITANNVALAQQLSELKAIYERTIRLADRFAIEKDQLSAANVKIINMLDHARINYDKLAASK